MPIPDFQSIMLPLLQFARDEQEYSMRDSVEHISNVFNLTDRERNQLLTSGRQAIINNRVGWAIKYLKEAVLLESTRRSYFRITERGLSVLGQNPHEINIRFLRQFQEFNEFQSSRREETETPDRNQVRNEQQTPLELLEHTYQDIKNVLARDLLNQILNCSPEFFERLVNDLLLKMGYGGFLIDAAETVGGSGDGGIDGIIKEDKLGLDVIYIQAKRWRDTVVGRPEIQRFVGALQGRRARKGIFITTSNYSRDAIDFVENIETRIILIDGQQLAQYMIDYNAGVSISTTYDIKRIDTDYFSEE